MKLKSLTIENFKGIKNQTIVFDDITTILGKNGTGKTTVEDALLWLIGGVDSTGRIASGKGGFGIRPHDENQEPILGLVTSVDALIDVDGVEVVLKKEHREKKLKGVVTGFEVHCFVDDVSPKVNKYEAYIETILDKTLFRMLADIHYFSSDNMHWNKRRKILLEITGDTGEPKGFEELFEAVGNRGIDGYKKVLKDQKVVYKEEADDIDPSIKENRRMQERYSLEPKPELTESRDAINKTIEDLKAERNVIVMKEGDRNNLIEQKHELVSKKKDRESELKNDTSNIQKYTEEKTKTELAIYDLKTAWTTIGTDINSKRMAINYADVGRDGILRIKHAILEEYNDCLKESTRDSCSLCGQNLPESMIDEYETKKAEKLQSIQDRGTIEKKNLEAAKTKVQTLNDELSTLQTNLDHAAIELEDAEHARDERFDHLDSLIAADVKVAPENDEAWTKLNTGWAEVVKKIGEPVTEQLADIDSNIESENSLLKAVNDSLANHDNAVKTQERITELSERETELGQLVTEIDGKLDEIEDYKMQQNTLIETAVNGLFKHITFRLFTTNLKGDPVDDCTAIYKGTQYQDCSTGEKIIIGIDIVNVLQKHHGVSIPLFVDNCESLTMPIESDSQIIRLVADVKVNKLKVALKE